MRAKKWLINPSLSIKFSLKKFISTHCIQTMLAKHPIHILDIHSMPTKDQPWHLVWHLPQQLELLS
jgi:hypothetical protein